MASFKPRTRMGRLACVFAVVFVVWWVANLVVFWLRMGETDSGATRSWLIALSWFGMACGVATAITAGLAVVRFHERSVAVLLCLAPGVFACVFLLGELLVPH